MDDFHKHNLEQEKPDAKKEQSVQFRLYLVQNQQTMRLEVRTVVAIEEWGDTC